MSRTKSLLQNVPLKTPCDEEEASAVNDAEFPNDYKIYVVVGAKCNGEKAYGAANTRKVAVMYKLEGGGVYCGES